MLVVVVLVLLVDASFVLLAIVVEAAVVIVVLEVAVVSPRLAQVLVDDKVDHSDRSQQQSLLGCMHLHHALKSAHCDRDIVLAPAWLMEVVLGHRLM